MDRAVIAAVDTLDRLASPASASPSDRKPPVDVSVIMSSLTMEVVGTTALGMHLAGEPGQFDKRSRVLEAAKSFFDAVRAENVHRAYWIGFDGRLLNNRSRRLEAFCGSCIKTQTN